MAKPSLETRLARLEEKLDRSNNTHIIWAEGMSPEEARRHYHGHIKPSDRVVYIGWEPSHDMEEEAIHIRSADVLSPVEITPESGRKQA